MSLISILSTTPTSTKTLGWFSNRLTLGQHLIRRSTIENPFLYSAHQLRIEAHIRRRIRLESTNSSAVYNTDEWHSHVILFWEHTEITIWLNSKNHFCYLYYEMPRTFLDRIRTIWSSWSSRTVHYSLSILEWSLLRWHPLLWQCNWGEPHQHIQHHKR